MDASRSRRRRALFLSGLVAILAALPVGYFLFLHQPPPPPSVPPGAPEVRAPPPSPEPPSAPEPARLAELQIKKIDGKVEVRRGGATWRSAQEGEALRASDAVRTLAGSYAVLIGGEAVEVSLKPGTEVKVRDLTDTLSRLLLERGMTTVSVHGGTSRALELSAAGSDAVARTQGGRFTVSNNGTGTVALASLEGDTTLRSHDREVVVLAGKQSIVLPGQEPSAPVPIPTSLLLKVNWPARPRREVDVSGQTEPGSHVAVNGQGVQADAQGRFSVHLSLKEGSNPVHVEASSVGGVPREEEHALTVDTTPPKAVTVDPGLWNDPAPPPP